MNSKTVLAWLAPAISAFLVLVVALSCAKNNSPEAQVKALIERAEIAAEEMDLKVLRELVSATYLDSRGNNKRAITDIFKYHIIRNRNIHLFVRTRNLKFPQPGQAEATLFVAMSGQPIPRPEDLASLRADLLRMDIKLADEVKGDWKVTSSEWRRAQPQDFIQ